ncbi:hypothetical protein [Janthinobacterium sp. BJB446]|nr:hypothetical protein [Janthinobacterium sp. BJB446]
MRFITGKAALADDMHHAQGAAAACGRHRQQASMGDGDHRPDSAI